MAKIVVEVEVPEGVDVELFRRFVVEESRRIARLLERWDEHLLEDRPLSPWEERLLEEIKRGIARRLRERGL